MAWTSRPSSQPHATTCRKSIRELVDEYDRAGPYWHHYQGIARYWKKRREAVAAR